MVLDNDDCCVAEVVVDVVEVSVEVVGVVGVVDDVEESDDGDKAAAADGMEGVELAKDDVVDVLEYDVIADIASDSSALFDGPGRLPGAT